VEWFGSSASRLNFKLKTVWDQWRARDQDQDPDQNQTLDTKEPELSAIFGPAYACKRFVVVSADLYINSRIVSCVNTAFP